MHDAGGKPKKSRLKKAQRQLVNRIKEHGGVFCDRATDREERWFMVQGGEQINAISVRALIKRELLRPSKDGLFGDSQTYQVA